MTNTYVPSLKTILCFCIEIETSSKFCCKSDDEHITACEAITAFSGNKVKKGDLAVVKRIFDSASGPFDFDIVHHLPLSPLIETTPIVIEMVYMEGTGKCFARIKNDLMHYDGVTATHVAFELLEYLEHGKSEALSSFPFTDSNLSNGNLPGANFGNFIAQLGLLLWLTINTLFTWNYWRGNFVPGPLQGAYENKLLSRPCLRFTKAPTSFKFKDFLALMDGIKTDLGISKYSVTVNFSPKVALAFLPDLSKLMSKKEILKNISLPPVGVSPPPPMDSVHVGVVSNTVFYNNYGRHKINITGKVVDFVWDWTGLCKSFPPLFHAIEINGHSIYRFCAPTPIMNLVSDNFQDMGPAKSFVGRPFIMLHSPSTNQVTVNKKCL